MLHGIWIGLLTSGGYFATSLIEDHSVALQVIVPIMLFVSSAVWWMASRFQRIDDRLKDIEKALDKCPVNIAKVVNECIK